MQEPAKPILRAHSHRIIGSVIYDTLISLGILMIMGFIAVFIHFLITGEESISANNNWAFQVYLLISILCYFFYFWKKSGQTVGMKAWKLKLISTRPTEITFAQLAVRVIVAVPAYGFLLLGVLWQYADKRQLNWHDIASHTKLIHIPIKK